MEKYIIILVILATIYYIQTKFKETEGFESVPAQSVGGIDDTNAINTLAQISKQLMVGGVTVPGAMTVTGALTVNGGITTPKGTGYKVTSSNGQSYGIWGGAGSGFATDNGLEIHTYKPDGGWAGNPLNIVGNDTRVNGNLNVGGEIRGNCAADQENGFRFPYHCWMKVARTDGGQDPYKLLYENSGKTVFRSPNGFEFRNPQDQVLFRIDNNGITNNTTLFRKHDTAGYFHIRAYCWRTPIYYGFNMMWNDNNIKEAVRAKWGWNESMFNNSIQDMRQSNDGDQNWTARYLVVFPGYKVRLYSWDGSFIDRIGVQGVGEHAFGDNNQRIHGIYVALAEEGDPPDRINW